MASRKSFEDRTNAGAPQLHQPTHARPSIDAREAFINGSLAPQKESGLPEHRPLPPSIFCFFFRLVLTAGLAGRSGRRRPPVLPGLRGPRCGPLYISATVRAPSPTALPMNPYLNPYRPELRPKSSVCASQPNIYANDTAPEGRNNVAQGVSPGKEATSIRPS